LLIKNITKIHEQKHNRVVPSNAINAFAQGKIQCCETIDTVWVSLMK